MQVDLLISFTQMFLIGLKQVLYLLDFHLNYVYIMRLHNKLFNIPVNTILKLHLQNFHNKVNLYVVEIIRDMSKCLIHKKIRLLDFIELIKVESLVWILLRAIFL